MAKMLDGLTVLDFTWALSGPFCTMTLCDLGARVIKVETPESGDGFRRVGPFVNGNSAYFSSVNRGKESISLNLKHPQAIELVQRLVLKVDVLAENFRAGVMERLGLGYRALSELNPRLIYLSVSGFGQTGPYRDRPAFDVVVQGLSGVMSINGPEGGEPTRVGTSVGDIVPGLYGVIGILSGLHQRERSGHGCNVDIGMMDSVVAIVENAIMRYWATGEVPGPIGSRHPAITPFSSFPTADGFVVIALANNAVQWERFCNLLGMPELNGDPRFADGQARNQHVHELTAIINDKMRTVPTAHWLEELRKADIPSAKVNTVADLYADPQVKARNMLVEIDQPGIGRQIMPGTPVKASGFEDSITRHAPGVGEHTDSVLAGLLGISEAEVDELRMAGAI